MSSDILDNMFENLVVYVWYNPNDDDDSGAVFLRASDVDKVREYTDYISDRTKAVSFGDFVVLLQDLEFPFYVLDNWTLEIYVHTGDK